jgi:hypothetical protein
MVGAARYRFALNQAYWRVRAAYLMSPVVYLELESE